MICKRSLILCVLLLTLCAESTEIEKDLQFETKNEISRDKTREQIDKAKSIKERIMKHENKENNLPSDESVLENSVVNQKNISPSHESDLNQQKKSFIPRLLKRAYVSNDKFENTSIVDDPQTPSLLLNEEEKSQAVIENDLATKNQSETENGKVQEKTHDFVEENINNIKKQEEKIKTEKQQQEDEEKREKENQKLNEVKIGKNTSDMACKDARHKQKQYEVLLNEEQKQHKETKEKCNAALEENKELQASKKKFHETQKKLTLLNEKLEHLYDQCTRILETPIDNKIIDTFETDKSSDTAMVEILETIGNDTKKYDDALEIVQKDIRELNEELYKKGEISKEHTENK